MVKQKQQEGLREKIFLFIVRVVLRLFGGKAGCKHPEENIMDDGVCWNCGKQVYIVVGGKKKKVKNGLPKNIK